MNKEVLAPRPWCMDIGASLSSLLLTSVLAVVVGLPFWLLLASKSATRCAAAAQALSINIIYRCCNRSQAMPGFSQQALLQ